MLLNQGDTEQPPLVTPDGAERRSGVQPVAARAGCAGSLGPGSSPGRQLEGRGDNAGP